MSDGVKTCTACGCPTEFLDRTVCPWCGKPYGDPVLTEQLRAVQRGKTNAELLEAMAGDDMTAAEEYARRLAAGEAP